MDVFYYLTQSHPAAIECLSTHASTWGTHRVQPAHTTVVCGAFKRMRAYNVQSPDMNNLSACRIVCASERSDSDCGFNHPMGRKPWKKIPYKPISSLSRGDLRPISPRAGFGCASLPYPDGIPQPQLLQGSEGLGLRARFKRRLNRDAYAFLAVQEGRNTVAHRGHRLVHGLEISTEALSSTLNPKNPKPTTTTTTPAAAAATTTTTTLHLQAPTPPASNLAATQLF